MEQLSELRARRRGYGEDQSMAEGGDESSRRGVRAQRERVSNAPLFRKLRERVGAPPFLPDFYVLTSRGRPHILSRSLPS